MDHQQRGGDRVTAALFVSLVAIFAVFYLGVQAVRGFDASRFDTLSDDARS